MEPATLALPLLQQVANVESSSPACFHQRPCGNFQMIVVPQRLEYLIPKQGDRFLYGQAIQPPAERNCRLIVPERPLHPPALPAARHVIKIGMIGKKMDAG